LRAVETKEKRRMALEMITRGEKRGISFFGKRGRGGSGSSMGGDAGGLCGGGLGFFVWGKKKRWWARGENEAAGKRKAVKAFGRPGKNGRGEKARETRHPPGAGIYVVEQKKKSNTPAAGQEKGPGSRGNICEESERRHEPTLNKGRKKEVCS